MSDSFSISCRYVEGVPAATDPAISATFAEVTIRVNGDVITRLEDRAGVKDSIFVPVAPIALWVLRSWPALFSERAPASLTARGTPHDALARAWDDLEAESDEDAAVIERELEHWERTHALRMAGDGLVLPDLLLRRTTDGMHASWNRWEPREHTTFLATGAAALDVEGVVSELRALVASVRQRIAEVPRSSSLAAWIDELAPRASAELTEAQVGVLADRLGEPEAWFRAWAAKAADLRRAIVKEYSIPEDRSYDPVLVDSPVAMAFRSAFGRLTEDDRARLRAIAKTVRTLPVAHELAQIRDHVVYGHGEEPGAITLGRAYRRAGRVRERFGAAGYFDVEQLLLDLSVVVKSVTLDDAQTDGVALWSEDRAIVLVNESSPRATTAWGRRSLFAHELYHLLCDVRAGAAFGEATGDAIHLPTEPFANAFAAELLAPKRELPVFTPQLWTNVAAARAKVAEVCDRFGVGRELALRQLQNRQNWPEPLVVSLLNDRP